MTECIYKENLVQIKIFVDCPEHIVPCGLFGWVCLKKQILPAQQIAMLVYQVAKFLFVCLFFYH